MARPASDLPSVLGLVIWGKRTRLERFWSKVRKDYGPNACWWWTGSRARPSPGVGDYGQLGDWRNILRPKAQRYAKPIRAHVLSWAIANDRWPSENEVVRHSCDHPACVNPDHLLIGSTADNIRDARERRRQSVWAAKDDRDAALAIELTRLTPERMLVLQALKRVPQPSMSEIARERGVSRQAIGQLVSKLEDMGMVRRCRFVVAAPIDSEWVSP